MVAFDLKELNVVPLDTALNLIQSGWVAQFRGYSWFSKLIQYGTGGVHSHSGMLRRDTFGSIDLLEIREWIGGRAIPFEDAVLEDPGLIDVFAPDLKRFPEYNGEGAARYMRHLTAKKYGYCGIIRLACQRTPLLWRIWPLSTNDLQLSTQAPFCSHAVTTACRLGGGVDPTPNKPDERITPNDLSWSLLFQYQFTVVVPKEEKV